MASLITDHGKRGTTYRIQFSDADGIRKTIRLGAMPKKSATKIKGYVENLIGASISKTQVDDSTSH